MTPVAIIGEEAREAALEARLAAQAARRRRAARGRARVGHDAARRAAVRVAAAALEARDGGTSAHSDDVVVLCKAIADRLGIRGQEREDLIAAAQLHDLGKVGVPMAIIEKPGPLDDREWQVMREHTVVGEEILSSVHELVGVARIVRSCHERYDGAGYPDGLAGEDIPLAARVVFCADAFHAMREDRAYRKGRSAAKALAELRRNAGTQFDPRVVDALVVAARELRQAGPDRLATLSAPMRSRRLLALLLTMMVGGSTLAAAGMRLPIPFSGSDEPDIPQASDRAGCEPDCGIADLGWLGRPFAAGPSATEAAGTAFSASGARREGAVAGGPLGATTPDRPAATGEGETPREGSGSSSPGPGEEQGSAPGAGEQSEGGASGPENAGGSGPRGEQGDPLDPVEEIVPVELPDLPVQVPDLPVQVPQLPVQLPQLPVQVPQLPVQVPRLP